nr:hypothetical protein [Tanacetum cinerariifolium]
MIFVDDIVLIANLVEGLNSKLESWMKALEDNGVRASRGKSEYLRCDFDRVAIRPVIWIRVLADHESLSEHDGSGRIKNARWTCGKSRVGMISNGVFRAELEVDSIIDKIREGRLRWFGHVKRRPHSAPVRRVKALLVDDSRRKGRPKLRWPNTLKQDKKSFP